jgi:hypothetical protein
MDVCGGVLGNWRVKAMRQRISCQKREIFSLKLPNYENTIVLFINV